MKELLITTFKGHSLASILFTVSCLTLLAIFCAYILINIYKAFITKGRSHKLKYWDKQERSLMTAFMYVLGWLLVAILMHYILPKFGIPMPL